MSAGDIDDRLGSLAQLYRYMEKNNDFGRYATGIDSLRVLRASIPYGAGISEDGQTIYIDSRLDTMFNGVDISRALAEHEAIEWGLREFCHVGVNYESDPDGHRMANRAELNKLQELFNANNTMQLWEDYDAFLDPQIRAIEKGELTNVPRDLSLYPYEGDGGLLKRIKEAQAQGPDTDVEGQEPGGSQGNQPSNMA